MNLRSVTAVLGLVAASLAGSFAIDHAIGPDGAGDPGLRVLDAARLDDLSELALGLQRYVGVHGRYVDTGNRVQSVCSRPADAGCGLIHVLPDGLPRDPGGDDYWLRSNGQRFTLYAARASDETPGCPDIGEHGRPVREHFGQKPLLCLIGP